MSPLELVAVVVSAYGVWLLARRSMWCWPVNMASVLLYGWIFFGAKLYSDMLLQGFFGISIIYGWWQWKRGVVAEGIVTVAKPSPRELLIAMAIGALGALGLGYAMAQLTDAAAPWVDSTLTSFSFVAQFWTARRFIESWWLWIALDVVYVGLFSFKQLYPTAGLYFVLMILCFYGVADWRRVRA